MKQATRLFFRSFFLSAVVTGCLFFGVFGAIEAYQNTRRIGFGEEKSAVFVGKNKIRIFDWEWEF